MASQFSEDQEKYLRQNFMIKGRILFPNLLQLKKKEKAEDRDIYDVQFAWLPGENAQVMGQIQQYMHQARQLAHAGINPQALIDPIKDFNTYVKQSGRPNPEYLRGHMWVNASTGKDFPPQVVKTVPGVGLVKLGINDEAEVWSGRNAVISINFWPMIPKPGDKNQKRGFYVNVNAVLLLEGGEEVRGAAAVDVNQVFGGFVQDMGMSPNFGGFGQQPPQQAPQQQPQWNQPAQAPQQQQWGNGAPSAPAGQTAPASQFSNQPPQWPPQGNGMTPTPQGSAMPGTPGPQDPAGQWGGQGGFGQMPSPNGMTAPQNAFPSNQQPQWPPQAPAQQPQQQQPQWNQPFNPNAQFGR